ncbi:hypothetical protein L1785_21350 [Antribacter sp. KLBMP9083]|uniref:DUF6973 domain-containing protein n=1 Tax=Antribacter soli TaxID=2910976 RepID=A0AA41QHY9_9MICO|nr:hypothetical protein [Antribacter soli]MCF4123518.1 hypothetical protein [Antribacter soli]
MSGTMWGQDPEQVRALAELLRRNADDLEAARLTADEIVLTVPWFGPGAAEFISQWEWDLGPSLTSAAEALRSAGDTALRNADLQVQTSESETGSSGAFATASGSDGGGSGSGDGGDNPAGANFALMSDSGSGSSSGQGEEPPTGPIPLEDRKPTGEILQEYQVAPDEMYVDENGNEGWKPSGWTVDLADWWNDDVNLDEVDPVKITKKEAEMLDDLSVFELNTFNDIRDTAFSEGDARFDSPDQNDDHNDAFRHAYWNALMAREYGQDWAHDYGTAHEQLPYNTAPAREAMDLYNNEVGRRIQEENPGADEAELAGLIEQAVKNGEMVVVGPDGTSLVYSDQITTEETGEAADADPIPGVNPEWKDS